MKNKDIFIRTFPLVWIYTFIVGMILFFTVGSIWATSFVLGSVTSLMMMSMLYKSSNKILKSEQKDAVKLAGRNYAFRFFFYALILIISALLDNLEILGTAAGLFSFKIMLYLNIFFDKRGESK